MRVTVADVMRAGPCVEYNSERLNLLWRGKEYLTHREIGGMLLPAKDRLWALIRCCMSDEDRRKFVRDCIGLVSLHFGCQEPEKLDVVIVSRWYAEGITSNEVLVDAWISSLPFIKNACRDSIWVLPESTVWAVNWASNLHLQALSFETKNVIRNVQLQTVLSYIEKVERKRS